MALRIPTVWSETHRGHEPGGEVWVGVHTPGTEVAARADRIREALLAAGSTLVEAEPHGEEELLAVHDRALLDYLAGAWEEWCAAGLAADPGQDRVVPYLFPHPGLIGGLPLADPAAAGARAGRFAFDTMTLIGPGTWEAARAAVDVALTAADLVLDGESIAYACCRPPGHHVTRTAFGGSCYLNNAAIAATRLRGHFDGPVAILDVDAHHGNGAQSIFYEDPGVLTGSVHVDPAAGWFPHFLGFAGERGEGDRRRLEPQPSAAPGIGRRALAGGGLEPRRVGTRGRRRSPGRPARSRRGGRRSREPPAGDAAPASRRRAGSSDDSACRRSSSRRAATTWKRSASWCWRRSSGWMGREWTSRGDQARSGGSPRSHLCSLIALWATSRPSFSASSRG